MNDDLRNLVPSVSFEFKCLWDGGQCGTVFESVGEFYRHVHEHAMSEPDLCCRWKGQLYIENTSFESD